MLKATLAAAIILSGGLTTNARESHSMLNRISPEAKPAMQQSKMISKTLSTPPTLSVTNRAFPLRKNKISFPNIGKRPQNVKASITSADGSKIYGCMIYNSTWTESDQPYGMYSFNYTDGSTITPVATGDDYVANGGGFYANGKFYFVDYMSFMGYVIADLYVCDFETWTIEATIPVEIGAIARDMTYDPTTGNVYGCFFNDDGDGWVFGRLSIETGERTVLSDLDLVFVTIAANSKGEIYGIDLLGDLYQFDKFTGKKTKIGSTGRTPAYSASGCFDLRTDKFYWECLETDAVARVFEVNTDDASLTLATTLPNSSEMVAMFIPVADAEDGAPAVVDDLSLNFDAASLSGTVTFTMPASTFAGDPLTGSLNFTVNVNEVAVATGTAEAGQAMSIPVSVTENGTYRFTVTTSNSVGNSPIATAEKWIGYDIPETPAGVKLAKGDTADALVLSWNPVTSTTHNGYIDTGGITYRIVRLPGDVEVASALTGTTFTDHINLSDGLITYSYQVYAQCGGQTGYAGQSNAISLGAASLPFLETFDENGIDRFYVIDANNDNYTWTYDPTWEAARIRYSMANDCTVPKDDWLFTPMVSMKSDRLYYFEFKTRCYMTSEPERIEVKLGQDQTVEAMTQEVFPVIAVNNDTYATYGKYINVATDGTYTFGLHACSLADKMYLYVDDVKIEEGPKLGTPNAVTNLKATAGENGALTATISFVAPTTTVEGGNLSEISSIKVKRDGTLIKTFDNPATGEALSFQDEAAKQGVNTYEVVAENSIGEGHTASVSVFVGHDIPGIVSNVKAVDNDGKVTITWDAPTAGATGGYFDPSSLTYYVFRYNDSKAIASRTTELSAVDDNPAVAEGTQDFFAYYVFAESPAGIGEGLLSNIIAVGTPFAMPFKESFPNCNITNDPWDVEAPEDSNGYWTIVKEGEGPVATPQDGDNGMLAFVGEEEGDKATLYSGKIDFTKANNPALQFYYYQVNGSRDYLHIYVSADGGDFEKIQVLSYYAQNHEDGWYQLSLDLSKYSKAKYIQIAFEGESSDGQYNQYLDNIRVRNIYDYNLDVASLSVPTHMKVGQTVQAVATVENSGIVPASKYTVNIVVNGEVVASQEGETLLQDEQKAYTFELTPTVHYGSEAQVYATVEWAKDQDANDNISDTYTAKVVMPNYPAVDDLTATRSGDMQVQLAWNEPMPYIADGKPIVDGAEDYEPFALTNIGDWKMVDVDKAQTYGIGSDGEANYNNCYAPKAFMVFNPQKANINETLFTAHSGEQFFTAFASNGAQNDDWMISPELPGTSQEISFYVSSYKNSFVEYTESYEVLYSATSDEIDDFIKIGSTRTAPAEWTQVKVVLPEGARYFAIRCVSDDCFIFMVDDIEYLPLSALGEELSLIGYNVYCNKQKLNDKPIEDLGYLHQLTDDCDLEYYVTVVYDKGESPMSNIVTLQSEGVNDAELSAVKVFGTQGTINVLNADGQDVAIFALDGKLIYSEANAGDLHVNVADKATYITVVGNKSYKVIVK